jgi:antitoxin PrlF
MNAYRPLQGSTEGEMSPDGWVSVPEHIRRAAGFVPGRPVVVGINDRGEVVLLTRTQARRRGETPAQTAERIGRAFDAIGTRFSTGPSTAAVMEELRGPRDA